MDFDLPDAKRIRRADLSSRSSPSLSPSPEATLSLQSRLAQLYGPIPPTPATTQNPSNPSPPLIPEQDHEKVDKEQAFEFRLFSTPSTSQKTQTILLHPSDEELGEGGFIQRERDKSFYLTSPATPLAKAQFQFAALSTDDVLQRAKDRNWGLEVPWRVTVVSSSLSTSTSTSNPQPTRKHNPISNSNKGERVKGEGRKKPGKKRRIVLRERERARVLKEEVKRKEREDKEEAEREKRTRRNREKKVKRKMKEKALKGGGVSGGGEGEDEAGE